LTVITLIYLKYFQKQEKFHVSQLNNDFKEEQVNYSSCILTIDFDLEKLLNEVLHFFVLDWRHS